MSEDFLTVNNVGMLQSDHCFHFSVTHSLFPRGELSFEGLECKYLFGLFIMHLVDHAKGTFAECFEHFKPLHEHRASWVRTTSRYVCRHIFYYK